MSVSSVEQGERTRYRGNSDRDLLKLRAEYGVWFDTIQKLLDGGIPRSALEEVLDIREALTVRDEKMRFVTAPTPSQMIDIWVASEGDMEILENIADLTLDLREEEADRIVATGIDSWKFNSGNWRDATNRAIARAIDEIKGTREAEV